MTFPRLIASLRIDSPENKKMNITARPEPELVENRLEARLAQTQSKILRDDVSLHARRNIARMSKRFMATDAVALILGFMLAWGLAAAINTFHFKREILNGWNEENAARIVQFSLIAVGVILWLQHAGHYRMRIPLWREAKEIVNAMGMALLIDGFIQFASRQDFSRSWLMMSWIFGCVGMIALRSLTRARLRSQNRWHIPTLLVGDGIALDDAGSVFKSDSGLGYVVVAQVCFKLSRTPMGHGTIFAPISVSIMS
jgi:hypothetical protein